MYDSIIDKLNSQIVNKKTAHAYLFEVNNYDDDFKIILNFVKMLLSNMTYSEVVNSNDNIFNQIDNNEYVDLYIVEPDNNMIRKYQMLDLMEEFNNKSLFDNGDYVDIYVIDPEKNGIKKNQMLDLMNEFNNKSLLNNKKIYIIKECDKFNASSANTILKFLEEPNEDIVGILLTNNRYKVIDTIISRCQVITFIDDTKFNLDDSFVDLVDFLLNIKKNISNYDEIYKEYFSDKNSSKKSLVYLEEVFINSINKNIDLTILDNYDNKTISNLIIIIEDELYKLKFNVNLNLWFDDFLVRVMEVIG